MTQARMTQARLVLDASMTLAWLLKRQSARELDVADRCMSVVTEVEAWVPELWHLEVSNVLCLYERRRLLVPQQSDDFLNLLDSLPVTTDATLPSQRREHLRQLARRHALSAYDAAYLDLALRHEATLATFDQRLADAARASGIRVFGDAEHRVHETDAHYRSLSDGPLSPRP